MKSLVSTFVYIKMATKDRMKHGGDDKLIKLLLQGPGALGVFVLSLYKWLQHFIHPYPKGVGYLGLHSQSRLALFLLAFCRACIIGKSNQRGIAKSR